MKKLFITIVCLCGTSAEALHLRLTETSITENGRIHALPNVRLVTKGYGLTYILPSGAGFSLTSLLTKGRESSDQVEFAHNYIDVSYNFGEEWCGVFGFGIALQGKVKIAGESSSSLNGTSYHLGAGYRWRQWEVMWIHRLNYARFEVSGTSLQATSTHYQLGIGYRM